MGGKDCILNNVDFIVSAAQKDFPESRCEGYLYIFHRAIKFSTKRIKWQWWKGKIDLSIDRSKIVLFLVDIQNTSD